MAFRTHRLLALVLLLSAAGSVPAHADPPAPEDAKTELAAGDAAANTKDWVSALAHFQASAQRVPSLRASMGMADALYRLNRAPEAFDAYTDLETSYGEKLPSADRATATARLAELATKTGWLSIRVAPPGAEVTLDGKRFGTSPVPALVRVLVGTHEVAVTKTGFIPFAGRAEVGPSGKAIVEALLALAPSSGHLVVRTADGGPLRVLVDGVDVGPAPWEGDLPPGQHEVAGRSSTATAPANPVTLVAGARATVDLAPTRTTAHLQVRTSDGKGLLFLDGAVRGEGAFAADVVSGEHRLTVKRAGYEPLERTLALAPNETRAETVTLLAIPSEARAGSAAERSFEGLYGGFGLAAMLGVGGEGTELETNCDALGAISCSTPSPFGGAVFGYTGWAWNPVGFEVMLGASFDASEQKAHFDGNGGRSGTLPFADPARDEKFDFLRVGGMGALRVRASFQTSQLRGTLAGGLGLSYKEMFMARRSTALDGSGRRDFYAPDSASYLSPAVSVEAALQWRVSAATSVSLGLEMWADNAGSETASPPSTGHALAGKGALPAEIPTPQYHFASGPQAFLLPFIGMQFGP